MIYGSTGFLQPTGTLPTDRKKMPGQRFLASGTQSPEPLTDGFSYRLGDCFTSTGFTSTGGQFPNQLVSSWILQV